jgi:hypothetical protein
MTRNGQGAKLMRPNEITNGWMNRQCHGIRRASAIRVGSGSMLLKMSNMEILSNCLKTGTLNKVVQLDQSVFGDPFAALL